MIRGADDLPSHYTMIFTDGAKSPFYDAYVNHTREGLPERTKISDIVRRIANVAEKAILAQGGEKRFKPNGETVYLIKSDFSSMTVSVHQDDVSRDRQGKARL